MQAGYNIKQVCFECQHYIWGGQTASTSHQEKHGTYCGLYNMPYTGYYNTHTTWMLTCTPMPQTGHDGRLSSGSCTPVPPYGYVHVFAYTLTIWCMKLYSTWGLYLVYGCHKFFFVEVWVHLITNFDNVPNKACFQAVYP